MGLQTYGASTSHWGTADAPQLFTGHCTRYSYRDAITRRLLTNMVGDNVAAALHSRKAEVDFAANVTAGSTDFLDLSEGAKIAISGITGGSLLAYRAVEEWNLLERK